MFHLRFGGFGCFREKTMDGRIKRLLAGGILCGLIGCSHFRDKSPKPITTGEPPMVMTDRPVVEERRTKNEPLKIETLLAVATVRMQAAMDENRTTQEKEELANQASQAYQKVLSREPKNLEAMRGMARMFAVLHDKDKCVEWYQRAVQAQPKNADIMYEMGKTLGSHFKDRDAMIHCLHTAAKLAPENRTYRNELGFSLALARRYDEGYAWLIRTMPEAKARYNLAGIAEHNGQTDQARIQLALAIKADPTHEPSKIMLAALSGEREKPSENSLRTVHHQQLAPPLPVPPGPSPTIPIDPLMPKAKTSAPAEPKSPATAPLKVETPAAVAPKAAKAPALMPKDQTAPVALPKAPEAAPANAKSQAPIRPPLVPTYFSDDEGAAKN